MLRSRVLLVVLIGAGGAACGAAGGGADDAEVALPDAAVPDAAPLPDAASAADAGDPVAAFADWCEARERLLDQREAECWGGPASYYAAVGAGDCAELEDDVASDRRRFDP